MIELPPGFFQVTGYNALRPVYIRARDVVSINNAWTSEAPDASEILNAQTQDDVAEMAQKFIEQQRAPPLNAEWCTIIGMEQGGQFTVREDAEHVIGLIKEALENDRG